MLRLRFVQFAVLNWIGLIAGSVLAKADSTIAAKIAAVVWNQN